MFCNQFVYISWLKQAATLPAIFAAEATNLIRVWALMQH